MTGKVGAYEAKTHLSELLRRVESGETITITKHGKPVAVMAPPSMLVPPRDVNGVIAEILKLRAEHGPTLGGITLRELIEQGRR